MSNWPAVTLKTTTIKRFTCEYVLSEEGRDAAFNVLDEMCGRGNYRVVRSGPIMDKAGVGKLVADQIIQDDGQVKEQRPWPQ